jgi:hypothetical protein
MAQSAVPSQAQRIMSNGRDVHPARGHAKKPSICIEGGGSEREVCWLRE